MLFVCYNTQIGNKLHGLLLANKTLAYELNNLGKETTITNFNDALKMSNHNDTIIACTSSLAKIISNLDQVSLIVKEKNIKLIVINTEQVDINEKWRNRLQTFFASGIIYYILDTYKKRLDFITTPSNKMLLYHSGYSKMYENLLDNKVDKSIDVLFYGNKNDRRRNLFERIKQRGINITFRRCFALEVDQKETIEKSKIVLDSFFYGVTGIDFYRCMLLACNKIFFIHETIHEHEDEDFLNVVVHADYENLPQKCEEWLLKSQEERDKKAEEVYEFFKKKYNTHENLKNFLINNNL